MTTARTPIKASQLLARYGADLAILFATMPQGVADPLLDAWCADVKREADAIRDGRVNAETEAG